MQMSMIALQSNTLTAAVHYEYRHQGYEYYQTIGGHANIHLPTVYHNINVYTVYIVFIVLCRRHCTHLTCNCMCAHR